MRITQNSVGTVSVLDALRYTGKQLYRSWVVLSYFYVFALFLGLFVFVSYQIHPEWEARHEAEVDAKFLAMDIAEMDRLAAERKQERILAAKRAESERVQAAKLAKRELILEAKRERVLEAKRLKQERLAAKYANLE